MYTIRGRTIAAVTGANTSIAQLWNPHATQRIQVWSVDLQKTTAGAVGDSFGFRRTSARGTVSKTVTGVIANHFENALAPGSGVLLDLGFTVQPTYIAGDLGPDVYPDGVVAGGFYFAVPGYIAIPPGNGLALVQSTETAFSISDVVFEWSEDR